MSIILKGIDLPKEGEWLEVIIKPTKEVIVDTVRYRDNALLKTEYGSATQIPKGHGRLIDADALELEKEVELADDWKTAHEIANCVKYAPTILEAEETDER